MLPSMVMNALIVMLVAGCVIKGLTIASPRGKLFRFFTTLSNLLLALSSAAVLACSPGELPLWTVIFKYAGTCAVTVTMLTVLLFLGPVSQGWKGLLTGLELILHLICPLLALVSFIFFEKTEMPLWTLAVGVAPVLIYGALYCCKVVFAPEERRWEDFYGFNRGGKWALSLFLMVVAAAVIAFTLWIIPA